jgi:hypothetical protein
MRRPTRTGQRGWRSGVTVSSALVATAAIVVVALVAVWAVDRWRDDPGVPQVGVTVSDVRNNPDRYFGERLTLSGEVNRVFSDREFTIGDGDILVVLEEGATIEGDARVQEGAEVMVEGVVQQPDAAAVQQQASGEALEEFEGPAVMVASHMTSPTLEVLRPDLPGADALAIQDVVDNFQQYEGQRITVVGEIARSVGDHVAMFGGLRLGEDSIIIAGDLPEGVFIQPIRAVVTGTVGTFSRSELEQELGIELEGQLVGDFEDEPTMLVEELTLLPRPQDIERDPGVFFEQAVQTFGRIDEVIAPDLFILDGHVLIVARGLNIDPIVGGQAHALGTVGVVAPEIRGQLGVDIDDDVLDEWQGRPYLLAEQVDIVR